MTDTNTSHAIYVLGDVDTAQREEMLAAKAAEHGAVIGETFVFALGEASGADDLSAVDAVVEALGRAIATHTNVWIPFWMQDICREGHLRALSITLQRHGLDLLLGPDFTPVPAQGGLHAMDAALRGEIRAVFALDDAAMAAAGVQPLSVEIEAALTERPPSMPEALPDEERSARLFSSAEVAALLGKSPPWVSRGVREKAFIDSDGAAIVPLRHPHANRYLFTTPMVRAIAWSAYRRGTLSPQRLEEVLAELRSAR